MEDRACLLGKYIAETGSTVRRAAQVFAISKSTVHKDVTVKLRREDRALYARVRDSDIENCGTISETAAAIWRDFCEHFGAERP